MGRLSLLSVLVLVCCSFASSLYPPSKIRRMKTSFEPLKKQISALQKGSMTSRRCSVVRRHTYFQKMNLPFLCHAATKRVIPWPRQKNPMTSMQMMMTMKANGWVPCPRAMPVPVYKFQRIPVCCPGTLPTPFGTCVVPKTVQKQQQQQQQNRRPVASSTPRGQLMRSPVAKAALKMQRQQLQQPGSTKSPLAMMKQSLRKPLHLAPSSSSSTRTAAAAVPLFPMLWKTPKPYRGFFSSGPRKTMGLGMLPPALLRMLFNRKVAPVMRTPPSRGQKGPAVIVRPRPNLPVPKPLPHIAFLLPLLTTLLQKSQFSKPSFKQSLTKTIQARTSSSSSPSPLSKTGRAGLSKTPLQATALLKSLPTTKALPKPAPFAPLFRPGPMGPLFQLRRLHSKPAAAAAQIRLGNANKPMVGPFPRALLDDFLFAPGPLSRVSSVKPLLTDLLDDLLFGSVSRPSFLGPLPKLGPVPNMHLPLMSAGPLSSLQPAMFGPGVLPTARPVMLGATPQPTIQPPFMPAAFWSPIRPPMAPFVTLRPPTIQDLLSNIRPPMVLPQNPLSNIRPPLSATSSLTGSKTPTLAGVLSQVISAKIAAELLSQNTNNNNNRPSQAQGSTFSNNNVRLPSAFPPAGPLSNSSPPPTNPASGSSRTTVGSPAAVAPPSQQEAKKARSGLSEWQQEVARYLATMMYSKLQVEQQHKTLMADVNRQNSLNRQMELLLAQQIIQTHQRRQQQKQMQDRQVLQQQQQQQEPQQQLQQQQQQEQQQQVQQQEVGEGNEQPDVSFLEPPILDSRPIPVPQLLDLYSTTTRPVLIEESLPTLSEMEPETEVEAEAPSLSGDQDLPFGPGILDEVPGHHPPVFSVPSPAQGMEAAERQLLEVRQQVKAIVNGCLQRSNISDTMELILQTGEPANLRPICRKGETVGPCVLAQTQDVMGQDPAGMAGRQLIQAVLTALGQTCAKLGETDELMDSSTTDTTSTAVFPNPPPEIFQDETDELMDSSTTDTTSTAVFPNPPPEIFQDVVTEVPPMEGDEEGSPTSGPTISVVNMVAPDVAEIISPHVLVDSSVTPLPAEMPEANHDGQTQEAKKLPQDTKVLLPIWMILVIIGTCAGLLLLTCTCVCLVLRCRRKSVVVDREPEKFPVPAEVTVAVIAGPPDYRKSEADGEVPEDNFKIPKDVGNK